MKPQALFKIKFVQYLDSKGQVIGDLPEISRNPADLMEMYRLMKRVRYLDQKIVSLQRTGKMGTFASSLGQEAISVGSGYALEKDDLVCPYYRDQGLLIQRNISLVEFLQYWGGDERGNHFQNNREDFPIAIPISTQLLHAAGMAYAVKLRKQRRAVLTSCGDGGTSEADFYTAINGAGTWNLPMVLVVNNNQWAISVNRKIQSSAPTLAQKGIAAGIDCIQVDGNDVIAVRHVVAEALEKARNGGGSTLIEALSYRLCDHTTADDASRYVDPEELKQAWELEPIIRLKTFLEQQGVLGEADEQAIEAENKETVDSAIETFLGLEPQSPESIFDFHYGNMPDALIEQKQEMIDELNS